MRADDERAELVAGRASAWRRDGLVDDAVLAQIREQFRQPWRAHGLFVQLVFFVLTGWALSALFGLLHILHLPKPGLCTGLVALAAAEVLIRRYRWFATGVESALWLGGVIALITALPSSGKPEAALVIAAGIATAAFRVRNPFFGVVAAGVVVFYFENRFDAGVVCALAFGVTGMLALLRDWRRPSAELFWALLTIVIPLAGIFMADSRWQTMTIAVYASFGAAALALAIARRHHALFVAAGVGLSIAVVDAAQRFDVPIEAKLAAGGAFLLAEAWAVSRLLRDRREGLVVTPENLTGVDEAFEVAGALAAHHATQADAPVADGRPQGGGGFGGAGATGEF